MSFCLTLLFRFSCTQSNSGGIWLTRRRSKRGGVLQNLRELREDAFGIHVFIAPKPWDQLVEEDPKSSKRLKVKERSDIIIEFFRSIIKAEKAE